MRCTVCGDSHAHVRNQLSNGCDRMLRVELGEKCFSYREVETFNATAVARSVRLQSWVVMTFASRS